MQAYFEEQRNNPPLPRLKAIREEGDTVGLVPDHPDVSVGGILLLDAMGFKDPSLGNELLSQMASVANGHEDALNAMVAFVRGHVETIAQQDSAERALNKLARTFTTQVQTLKRYRTGGEQKVTVQHVSVNDNAQAVVGNISTGGDEKK
jgi:hypothetical protein